MRRLAVLATTIALGLLACAERPKDDSAAQTQEPAPPPPPAPTTSYSALPHKGPLLHHGPMVMKPLGKAPLAPAAASS